MSCLDVMYQVYGPPQPYFAAAYTPYHQKLAYYSKMQEAQECNASPSSSASGSSSFSNQTPASVKEEEDSPEKERPPEAEYINSRCVLFTYFQGDISSVVDEHFSRALSQPSSYTPSCTSSKAHRSSGPWRAEGTFPMSQRSFPASFWNSAYQAPVPAPLGSPLAAAHSELPFAADPYSPAALHGHLHQGAADWHHAHPHHAHPHHPYALGGALGAQASAYPRPAVHEVYASHFDPRYGPLLMPAASGRPGRLAPASAPAPGSPPCELAAKGEPAGGGWAAPGGAFVNPAGEVAQSLGLSVDSDESFTSPEALLQHSLPVDEVCNCHTHLSLPVEEVCNCHTHLSLPVDEVCNFHVHHSLPVDEVCGYHKKMADVNSQPKRDMIKKHKDSRFLPHIPASSSCLVHHLAIAPTPERHALSCEL